MILFHDRKRRGRPERKASVNKKYLEHQSILYVLDLQDPEISGEPFYNLLYNKLVVHVF